MCGVGVQLGLVGEVFLDLFPLPSPILAASLCDLCIPTPTPAFIGFLKPYGGLSPPHRGFIVPTRDGGSVKLPYV
jgi:hypothetical protein